MANSFCPSCGTAIPGPAGRFCPSCGSRFPGTTGQDTATAPAESRRRIVTAIVFAAGLFLVAVVAAILVQAFTIHVLPAPAAANTSALPGISVTPEVMGTSGNISPAVLFSDPYDSENRSGPGLPVSTARTTPVPSHIPSFTGPVVTVTGTAPYPSPAPAMGSSADVPVINATSLAERVHVLVNRERAAHGISPLGTDPALASVARAHSEDMASNGYFGHMNLQDRDATARGAAAGFACHRQHDPYYTSAISENLFATYRYDSVLFIHGSATGFGWKTEEMIAEETVDGWMKSPDHRENLLDGDLAREGIGVTVGANDLVFVTEDLC